MSININNTETSSITYTSCNISVAQLNLGVSAVILVIQYSPDAPPKRNYLNLVGDEYTAWGSDDNYIINWALDQLDLTPINNT